MHEVREILDIVRRSVRKSLLGPSPLLAFGGEGQHVTCKISARISRLQSKTGALPAERLTA